MGPGATLRYQPPGWLTPERIATGTAAIGAALIAVDWVEVARVRPLIRMVVVVLVAAWVAGTVHLATRRGTSRSDTVVEMLWWVPLSGAALATLLAAVALLAGHHWSGLVDLVFVAMGGYLAGFLFALPALPLAVIAASGRTRPSHEAPVRALVGAGLWLLGVALPIVAFDQSASFALLAPGALLLVVGAAWTLLRARFVRRVRAGREPGFVIVDSEGGAVESGLLPYRPLRGVCIVDTLAAVARDTAGVYRGEARPTPLCLLERARWA